MYIILCYLRTYSLERTANNSKKPEDTLKDCGTMQIVLSVVALMV